MLSFLALQSTLLFAAGGFNLGLAWPFYAGLSTVAAHYAWQIHTLDINSRENCWQRFQSNRVLGCLLLMAIIAGKAFKDPFDKLSEE